MRCEGTGQAVAGLEALASNGAASAAGADARRGARFSCGLRLCCSSIRTTVPGTLLLTVRGSQLRHHTGQVSLPAGRIDPGESVEDAALREANEKWASTPRSWKWSAG
jgi:hypothetical protein